MHTWKQQSANSIEFLLIEHNTDALETREVIILDVPNNLFDIRPNISCISTHCLHKKHDDLGLNETLKSPVSDADENNSLGENINTVKNKTPPLLEASKEISLEVNTGKLNRLYVHACHQIID